MKIKCEYCGGFIEDTDETCEHCGAVNSHLVRAATGIPKTIEELKAFAKAKNLPLEEMRFFLGEDYKEPRAFGIYYDEKEELYVVYKNKSDGSRAIRYQGKDESYAVNEIYQKMKSEMLNQRAINIGASTPSGSDSSSSPSAGSTPPRKSTGLNKLIFYVLIALFAFGLLGNCGSCISESTSGGSSAPASGYSSDYDYGSDNDSGWGSFFDDDDDYDSGSDSWDSDWDSDWDFGGDWDSGGSDWDSDW